MNEILREFLNKQLIDPGEFLRLWRRVQKFIEMKLVMGPVQNDALELACYALNLPAKPARVTVLRPTGKIHLDQRAKGAIELLMNLDSTMIAPELMERTTRLLADLPLKAPRSNEARLLADAMNLEDFGITALFTQAAHSSPSQLAENCEKKEQYGYWDARLKDSFQFQPVREMARRRLDHARQLIRMLQEELKEDQP